MTEQDARLQTPGGGEPEEPATVLLVDDNATNLQVLFQTLNGRGYKLLIAKNGEGAIATAQKAHPQLILLDIMMPPGIDGYETCRRLKADPATRDCAVIFLSALGETEDKVKGLDLGAVDFISKPFQADEVIARVNTHLSVQRLKEKLRRQNTDLEKALKELSEAQERLVLQEKLASLGSLAAGIAHEIKNPLNFIINFSTLSCDLLDELQEVLGPAAESIPDAARQDLTDIMTDAVANMKTVVEHGRRADGIVRNMLLLSRDSSGEFMPTNLNSLLRENVNLAYHEMRAQDTSFNIDIAWELDEALPAIQSSAPDLGRVILNISSNAIHAMRGAVDAKPPDWAPALRISSARDGDGVLFRIRDNGTGIPEEVRAKLFQPFFTTKRPGEGTGLGLSLSHDIVTKQHRGTIEVRSEPGEFAEFEVRLPPSAPNGD